MERRIIEETFEQDVHPDSDTIDPVPFCEMFEMPMQTENSSSFPSDNNELGTDELYDQSSITNDPITTDSIDNLLANLTEDNANSLPSGDVGSHFASIHESRDIEFNNAVAMDAEASIGELPNGNNVAEVEAASSSVSYSEIVPPNDLENGASMVETGVIELDGESSASGSQFAEAEDLPNGGENMSQVTAVDVDAEMVSEDELPAPTQEKVTDAEEVSDEELPGPKLAELPADTEVVSEDELPTPVKRKVDDGYDPGSPTESSEVPEKKAKKGDDGGNY